VPARRLLAVGALFAALMLAWWSTRAQGQTLEAVFLLTRASVEVEGVRLGRDRLTRVAWSAPDADGRQVRGWFDFAPGQAPEVSPHWRVTLAADATAVDVQCQFELGPGLTRINSHGRVRVVPGREGEQVVELDCGAWHP
jgi:hypothetical protein